MQREPEEPTHPTHKPRNVYKSANNCVFHHLKKRITLKNITLSEWSFFGIFKLHVVLRAHRAVRYNAWFKFLRSKTKIFILNRQIVSINELFTDIELNKGPWNTDILLQGMFASRQNLKHPLFLGERGAVRTQSQMSKWRCAEQQWNCFKHLQASSRVHVIMIKSLLKGK